MTPPIDRATRRVRHASIIDALNDMHNDPEYRALSSASPATTSSSSSGSKRKWEEFEGETYQKESKAQAKERRYSDDRRAAAEHDEEWRVKDEEELDLPYGLQNVCE